MSGGSAEYADYSDIDSKLDELFRSYRNLDWPSCSDVTMIVADFLLELWNIHPFREGNTRTCVTFLWHYLKGKGLNFQVELLRKNPMYVRDSLVMANYDQKEYLYRIVSDALTVDMSLGKYDSSEGNTEAYQIAKSDYEAFRDKNNGITMKG